jgi:hypothetical protein
MSGLLHDAFGPYPPPSFSSRCLAAACAATDHPEGGSTAVVEVTLEEALELHRTWIGDDQSEPRLPGDLVGWCQGARVMVARGEAPDARQLALFGAAT